MASDATFIGVVQDVHGATISVGLNDETVTGLSFVQGEGYRAGQVGSFVKIPLGFTNLYGVVSQVGAGAAPVRDRESMPFGNRWLSVQLVGEGSHRGRFVRGISQYPSIDDHVHIVTEKDLQNIYGPGDPQDFVAVGHLASAESIPALININKLVTRHSAVVGTTGAGKSTTVAGLLASLSEKSTYPSSRILILDIHGEYAHALSDRASVFRISPDSTKTEKQLCVPFWALNLEEFSCIAFGGLEGRGASVVADMILELKREAIGNYPKAGVTADTVSADSPVPFCAHKMWLELHRREHLTVVPAPGGAADEKIPAYVLDAHGQPIQTGDALSVTAPQYRNVKTTGPAPERVQLGNEGVGIRQQLSGLAAKLRDPRFAFMFHPAGWLPQLDGQTQWDLDDLLADWIGGDQPVTILDLSGIPSSILNELIGALLRVLYDALFWGRNLPEGGRERPLLIVLEEAHNYLGKGDGNSAARTVRRIAKEGRKYGVGLMIVSQRPSEIDSTILSQCGTLFAMRLSNDLDRGQVKSIVSDNLTGLFEMLPVLRTGEAIIVGESVSLPVRTLIDPPPKNRRPDSADPRVIALESKEGDGFESPGGWNQARDGHQSYAVEIEQWRRQSTRYVHDEAANTEEAVVLQAGAPDWTLTPESTTLSRIWYEPITRVLAVEFRSGGIYEFYDVPTEVYEQMFAAPRKGLFITQQLRGHFRYARS